MQMLSFLLLGEILIRCPAQCLHVLSDWKQDSQVECFETSYKPVQ